MVEQKNIRTGLDKVMSGKVTCNKSRIKAGDLIKFQDLRYSSSLNSEVDLVGMIIDMKVMPWDEVTNVKVIAAGQTFWIYRSQIMEVLSEAG